eukprot:GSChrysophyteH2.ASY1.ANO1.684.1 assembled CDS
MEEERKDATLMGFMQNMMSGGMSGIVSKTMSAPVDRVKLILQTQNVNTDVTTRYKGLTDCFSRVYKEQGLFSFWRGNGANLLRYFPHQALSFAFKDKLKAFAALEGSAGSGGDSASIPLWKIIVRNIGAAGIGGGMSLVLLYPLDMARTRLAADVGSSGSRRFTGTADCLKKIYAENGFKGVYTGIGVSITGVVVFRGLFMGGYDTVKHVMDLDTAGDIHATKRLLAAQIVTVSAGTLCYPIDTVRRRVMMQSKAMAKALRYKGAFHAFFTILREEGVRGLYSGLSANLIRGFAGPVLLVSYDLFKTGLRDNM